MFKDLTIKSGLEPCKKKNKNVVMELNTYFHLLIIEFNHLPAAQYHGFYLLNNNYADLFSLIH